MLKNRVFSRNALTAVSAMLVACSAVIPAIGAPSVSKPRVPTFRKPAPAVTKTPECVPGQFVIEVSKNADGDEVKKDLADVGGTVLKTVSDQDSTIALVQVSTDSKKCMDSFAKLSKDKKNFDLVQLNRIYHQSGWPNGGFPNDTDLLEQFQYFVHDTLGGQTDIAGKGFDMPVLNGVLPAYPGRGPIVIGLLDTGCEALQNNSHMDFYANQILPGLNAVTGTPTGNIDLDASGFGGHGSFCSGIMAAATNNNYNGAGFLPGAQIDPVNVFGTSTNATDMSIVIGLKFLQREPGVKFVNASIQGTPPFTLNADPVFLHAVAAFNRNTGGAVFNAAGNAGLPDLSPFFAPNGVPLNIVVSAVDQNRNLASFSNFGTPILFSGLGVDDGSTIASGSFVQGDGTSFATPSCCAIAAALQYLHPNASLSTIIGTMVHNTRQCGGGHPGFNNSGFGLPSYGECVKNYGH